MIHYEQYEIEGRAPLLERTALVYSSKTCGFGLRFSWYAWFLRKIHGPDATKLFWLIKKTKAKN